MSDRQPREPAGPAKMPVLFVGHGSPINAVEHNDFAHGWEAVADRIPRPGAVLCISAHWYADQTLVNAATFPSTIHDFYGFPPELYRIRYPAPGATNLALGLIESLGAGTVGADEHRGIDHRAWVVLRRMYPKADIPVAQLSVNYQLGSIAHYRLGASLKPLRDQGVLILGSGNIVHNLGLIDWASPSAGFDWAEEFRVKVNELIITGAHPFIRRSANV